MFRPYHMFWNCQRLRKLICNLRENNNVPEPLWKAHNKYHYAVFHKLKSTQHYTENLANIFSNTPAADIFLPSSQFFFNVNRNIDGFFHSGGSALDILAREVLTYFGIPLPSNVYFHTAKDELTQHRPNDAIISRLGDPTWKADFSDYRNAITHELLVADSVSVNFHIHGETQTEKIILPLPDNSRSDPSERTYRKYPDVLDYCNKTLKRLLSLVNQVYGNLTDRITQNNSLPI